MKERTKELLEKNSSLLKDLYRISGIKEEVPGAEDEVDRFFSKQIKKRVREKEKSDIIKNEEVLKEISFNEKEANRDLELLYSFISEAWKTNRTSDLITVTRRFYTEFLPGGVWFSINEQSACGLSAFGDIMQESNVIRAMKIPLMEQSVLRDVYITREIYHGPLMPSLWNNFISNRLIQERICPNVIALPLLEEGGVKAVLLSGELTPDFTDIKITCLRIFVFQIKKIIEANSRHEILSEL